MIEVLKVFYPTHYNFAALCILLVLLLIYLLTKKNYKYPFYTQQPQTMTFSVKKNWTITDEKGVVHHWCWVEEYWQKFASVDLVAKLWGTNSSKKLVKSSEKHAEDLEK